MTLLALLLAGLASTGLCSICCPPLQWEAYQFITRVDPNGASEGLQSVSYDALNGRYAVEGNYTSGNVNTFKVIYDYRKKVGYRIDPVTRSCETFAIKEEFQDTCVPDDASLLGPFNFGFGTKVIDCRGYGYIRTIDGVTSKFTVLVSEDICAPVITHKITLTSAGNSFLSTGYNNIFPGIRDNTIFSPPIYCEKGKAEGPNNTFKKSLHRFTVV